MCPIKGLSESVRLPRIGKIHLGVKKVNKQGVEYPAATDYFVCPDEIKSVYGDQPQRLDIIIPVEDEEMWASQYYRQYSRTRGLVCKSDGVTCRRMVDAETSDIANRDSKTVAWQKGLECKGRECPDYQAKKCQEVMNLQFLLPRVPGLGIWQIDTGSINSIRNINDAAAMVRAVCDRISWVPLVLTLEPTEVVNPEDGEKKTVRCLHLRHEKGLLELLQASQSPKAHLLITTPAEDEPPMDSPDGKEDAPPEVVPGRWQLPHEPPDTDIDGAWQEISGETIEMASDDQRREIADLAIEKGLVQETREYMRENFNTDVTKGLTASQARAVIAALRQGRIAK